MDQNRDWKLIAVLVLAGLALFLALGGPRGYGSDQASAVPQQIIVQPVVPADGTTGGAAQVVTSPGVQTGVGHAWGGYGGWRGGWPIFPLFPLLFVGGLIFLAFWLIGRNRRWGGPGWYGGPWGGPGPGPQAPPHGQPYGQYPQGQWQGQHPEGTRPPYGSYPQGPQPQPQQGQPTQATDAHGDITRPEGRAD